MDGWITVKCESTGSRNRYVHDLPAVSFGAVKDDDPIATRAAHHASGILFAWAFDEDLHLASDEPLKAGGGALIDELKEPLITFFLGRLRHLAIHVRGRGIASR